MNPARPVSSSVAPGPLSPLVTGRAENPFVIMERKKRELLPAGLAPINFSIGDPCEPTPAFIRDTLRRELPEVSSYPTVAGLPELRTAFCGWFERRFGVKLDPERHVLPANGTKEAVFLMAFAMIDREGAGARRTVVIPSPAYPVYEPAARFAGGEPHLVPLTAADGWRFRPERVADSVWERTALLWLNSPHNPSGAVLDLPALEYIAALARRHGFWVAADEAYAELYFGDAPHSMLECGLENIVALHTLSKRSAMSGYRSGFMAGDPRLIEALRRMRPHVGVATPEFIQSAAAAAWRDDAHAAEQRAAYAAKRALFLDYFARRGWNVEASEASFYLWFRAPGGDDEAFVDRLLRAGLVALPGSFLGAAGTGLIRWALVPTLEQCREAMARLEGVAG